MNPYSYTNNQPRPALSLQQTTARWRRYAVDFPSAHPTRYEENNTVRGEYFQPRHADKAPLVILSHGMGDELLIPGKFLARALVREGIACFIIYSIFHSRRMPETVRKRLPVLTPEEWFENYRISVIDVRQVVDWASRRSELNEKKVGPVLMLNASWDEYIPKESTLDFREACGKPPITWFPATHATIWLWYPLIRRNITRFLRSTLEMRDGHGR
ncbi:MAG: hypothetical protein V3R36_01080 [Dehalococcoidales bacterium]